MHAPAQGRQQAQAQVAQLVAAALEHQLAVVGDGAGGGALLLEVRDQVLGRARLEEVLALQAPQGLAARRLEQLARQPADGPPQLERPRPAVGLPERHLAGLAGGRLDQHAVARDLDDAPARGPQHEDLARAALEDHLLVELAHPEAAAPSLQVPLPDQVDAVEPAVGDRAGVGHRHGARPVAGPHAAAAPVPHQARAQLGEGLGGVAPSQQVEHAEEGLLRQACEGGRPAHQLEELVHGPLALERQRDQLLGQHVQRVLGHARGLHRAVDHGAREGGHGQQVAAELGEQHALRDRAGGVARAADALQPRGHRGRRLDLDHQVHGAHVDAQLERRGGHQRGQPPGLERVFDLQPLLARDRAVVGPAQLLAGQLVQGRGQALGQPAGVDEKDGGAVLAHQLQQARVHRGPDRPPLHEGGRSQRDLVGARQGGLAQARHVLHRHLDPQLDRLPRARVDDADRARTARAVAAQVARHLVERALRGRQPQALRLGAGQGLQALQRERQVGPALGGHQRVDLVHDHRGDRGQQAARLGGQHQVERLGRGDQDVGRSARQAPALARRRVARAQAHLGDVERDAQAPGGARDAHQRRAQVALDVHGQGPQRRDVEHAAAPALLGDRREHEPVDGRQEGRQRLARARGGEDQGRAAGRDLGPAQGLGARGLGEGLPEPGRDRRLEVAGEVEAAAGAHPVIMDRKPATRGPAASAQ